MTQDDKKILADYMIFMARLLMALFVIYIQHFGVNESKLRGQMDLHKLQFFKMVERLEKWRDNG